MAFSEQLKLEIRRRSHHSCCLCKTVGIEIHHIIPQEEKGPDLFKNAAPLCPSCHETFGANPTKRKMIKEARDLWYEICDARYKSDEDRISELIENVSLLRKQSSIPEIARSVADEVIERLSREGLIQRQSGEGWPISKLLERISQFEKEFPKLDHKSKEVTYAFLFEAKGDTSDKNRAEYNETRNKFIVTFGSYIARNICAFEMNRFKINWVKGVPETKLQKILGTTFMIMTFLLWHEDVGCGPEKIKVSFENKDFKAWLPKSNKVTNKAPLAPEKLPPIK